MSARAANAFFFSGPIAVRERLDVVNIEGNRRVPWRKIAVPEADEKS